MEPHLAAARDAARLTRLEQYDILDTAPEPAFDDAVELARALCAAPIALVSLVDADRQWFKAGAGLDARETGLDSSICSHVLAARAPFVIADLAGDQRTSTNPLVTGPPHARFYAGVPLETPDGAILGTLCVLDTAPRPDGLSPAQLANLQRLARQVMAQLELRRLARQHGQALRQALQSDRLSLDRALASQAQQDRLREDASDDLAAQQAGGAGLFQFDIISNEVRVSPEFCRLFGLPRAATYPLASIEALIVPIDRPRLSTPQELSEGEAPAYLEFRIRRPDDGTIRWIGRQADFTRDASGRAVRFVGTIHDITDRKTVQARQTALVTLGDSLRNAATIAQAIRIAVSSLSDNLLADRAGYGSVDLETGSFHVEACRAAPGIETLTGRHPMSAFPGTFTHIRTGRTLVRADHIVETTPASGSPDHAGPGIRAELAAPLLQGERLTGMLFLHSASPRRWSEDEVAFVEAVADRTHAAIAKLTAEEERRLLGLELEHRLKNTFAMVQALVSQTLRDMRDRPEVKALMERLTTLGRAHDILLQQNWNAARIGTIVHDTLALQAEPDHLVIEGPDLMLGPRGTLSLSMLLHELATNALKYGALSVADGKVSVSWRIDNTGDEPVLCLSWTETAGPATKPPMRRGFGSKLIAGGLLGTGKTTLRYPPEGFLAEFRAPFSRMAES